MRKVSQDKRAVVKAKRDARNPLYKRLAKKLGETTKAGTLAIAKHAGKQIAQKQKEINIINRAKSKAKISELVKISASQGREQARSQIQPKQQRDPLGIGGMGNLLMFDKPKKVNQKSQFNPLGMKSHSKKNDFFEGLI